MKLRTISLLLCLLGFGGSAAARSHGSVELSAKGGEWHDPASWNGGKVPPTDNTELSLSVRAPLHVATGTVTIGSCRLSADKPQQILRIGPLGHLNVCSYLSAKGGRDGSSQILVAGSLMLHRSGSMTGDIELVVKGGYVHGMGRRISLRDEGEHAPTLKVSEGGVVYVRELRTHVGTRLVIENGEVRLDEMECDGATKVDVRNGTFSTSKITDASRLTVMLREGGELLLKGDLDATTLGRRYRGLTVGDGERTLAPGELRYEGASGPERFAEYTRITTL